MKLRLLTFLIIGPLLFIVMALGAEAALSEWLGCQFDYEAPLSPCLLLGWDVSYPLFYFGMASLAILIAGIPLAISIALFSLARRSKGALRRQTGSRP